ncbi:unnamed protein product [Lactuca saligna]|uniref:Uncharacterized protein n=1 Tax=Lactuca saligna TaxID=75948 RepID=A0AA35UVG3_LACSI|nr:unnamed protein product [Lactuca saligna]
MVCQDVTPTDRPPEETKGDVYVNPCVIVVILSSFTSTFDKKFCVIGDGEVLLMIQRLQGQLLLDDDKMLYPIEDNMGEVSQRNILGGCDQTRKVGSCGESNFFIGYRQPMLLLVLRLLLKNIRRHGVKLVMKERRRMVSILLQTIFQKAKKE